LDDPTPYIKQYAAYHTSRLRSDISYSQRGLIFKSSLATLINSIPPVA
jgi:hypothetical protein